eukprot:TRINITY_DN43110_c0_g1_i1.p1 TRINITY_DN43110_c0_g1~~TRINITY_DN43110_c0_g1_i1.p1  ORF type:complete len:347 (-),score=28.21 TRINITY_DN43110_c0_g1_i1:33-1073(-)
MDETSATSKRLLDAGSIGQKKMFVFLQILVFITGWWTTAIVVIMSIKKVVKPGGIFPHAFTFTAMCQTGASVMASLISMPLQMQRHKRAVALRWIELGTLAAIGLMQGVEMALTNKALQELSVSERTILNSTCVLFLMTSAWLWGLEGLGHLKIISALFLVTGGMMEGLLHGGGSQGTSRIMGIPMQLASITISAQRWCILQFILQRSPPESALSQMSKMAMLARVMPLTGVCCLFLGMAFEPEAFSWANFHVELLWSMSVIAVSLSIMLWMELLLVRHLSAVAFNVLSTVHQIPIVLAGVIFQHDALSIGEVIGFTTCILGAFIYGYACHLEDSGKTVSSDLSCH